MVRDTNSIPPTTTDELLAEISQYWANYQGTNLWQLVDTFNQPLNGISASAGQVEKWREINQARGSALDIIGQDHRAYRTSDDDDFYRFLIYLRLLLARAQGTASNILTIAKSALQKDGNFKIFITSPRHFILKMPYSLIENVKSEKLILSNLKQLTALGTWLDRIDFEIKTNAVDYFGATITANESNRLKAEWAPLNYKTDTVDYFGATVTANESNRLKAEWASLNYKTNAVDYFGATAAVNESIRLKTEWGPLNYKTTTVVYFGTAVASGEHIELKME